MIARLPVGNISKAAHHIKTTRYWMFGYVRENDTLTPTWQREIVIDFIMQQGGVKIEIQIEATCFDRLLLNIASA